MDFPIKTSISSYHDMAVCQNLVRLVNIKIAGKWMFIPLKMVFIGIDPYPYVLSMIGYWRVDPMPMPNQGRVENWSP